MSVRLACYVDDVALEMAGAAGRIVELLPVATVHFTGALQRVGMEFSVTNSVSASSSDLGNELVRKLAGIKVQRRDRVKSLGAALGAGRRRNAQVTKGKLKAFRLRVPRFHVLKKAKVNVPRILRTGAVAAMTYGQETMGVANTTLLNQRRAAASALVTEGNGDLDLRLALADGGGKAKVDPAFPAHLLPIGSWAEAVWCSWLPHGTLRLLMEQVVDEFRDGVVWARVRGPAAACYPSVKRLGWAVLNAVDFVTDTGQELKLTRDSPAFVKQRVTESVLRWRGRAIAKRFALGAEGEGDVGAHLHPIMRLLAKGTGEGDWTWEHRGALRSAVTGRQWTQSRLFRAGLADAQACQLCVATLRCEPCSSDPRFTGTLMHRHCTCPSREGFRDRHMPASVKESLRASLLEDGSVDPHKVTWFTRALRAEPFAAVPRRDGNETFEWIKRQPDGVLEGDVYTDGSLMDNDAALQGHCRALGWSFVVVDRDGLMIAAAHGRPPDWVDNIFGAELWAVQMAVTLILPGSARVLTDCESVRIGCQRGSKWTTAPGRVYARIWAVIHATGDSADLAPVIWMPAHAAEWQVGSARKGDGSVLTATDRVANDLADRFAKAAAEAHRVAGPIREAIHQRHSEVTDMAVWIARVTVEANHFKLGGGSVVRDSLAVGARGRRGVKRRRAAEEAGDAPLTAAERLFQHPRLAALRERVLAKALG